MNTQPETEMGRVVFFAIALIGLTSDFQFGKAQLIINKTGNTDSFAVWRFPDFPGGENNMQNIDLARFRSARKNHFFKWPNGLLTYFFPQNNFTDAQKDRIRDAMRKMEYHTHDCVRFKESSMRLAPDEYIEIVSSGKGCFAGYIGRWPLGNKINLSTPGCLSTSTIMHEIMHVLGFAHEQSRPDRDQYINYNMNNIGGIGRAQYFLGSAARYTTNGLPYDYGSIMHYPIYAYAIDRTLPVMSAKSKLQVPPRVIMGEGSFLTRNDVIKIQTQYGCAINTSRIDSYRNVTYLVYCNFEDTDSCNLKLETSGKFQWRRRCGSAPPPSTGPRRDFTSGSGNYLHAEAEGLPNMTYTLRTPVFKPGTYCFRFAIFRYNPDPGVLTITLEHPKHNNETQMYRLTKGGFQRWAYYFIFLNTTLTSNVLISHRVGNGPLSDLALDEIKLYPAPSIINCREL